ncbi:RimK family alpha-L-glutamate ligase [Candidatus Woesearchaeota archaeon]|nr:RimK family alpha-L-glutamate ligase [Candidatus Woesearchaeota archaeon]
MENKKLKGAIVSLGSKSSLMVAEAMKKYFGEVDMIQLKDIEVSLGKEGGVFYQGEPLKKYDCLYLKGSFRYANLLRSIASMLEDKVPYMPLASSSFTIVHNKLLTHLALQQHNIAMPRTYISSTPEAAKAVLKKIQYPAVMKFPEGTQGKGVMFAESFSSASSMLDALGALKQPFIIQEYVETGGSDIRALVVGDRVIASMRRVAQKDEKRANIHIGGVGEYVELDRVARKLAIDTAKALKVDICGVDILESPLGPAVIEANVSPGLQGLSEVSTIDIADEIARFLFNQTDRIVRSQGEVKKAEATMKTLLEEESANEEIITPLDFRGERVLLPELATKMAQFDDRKEYSIIAKKGKVEIKEF